MTRLVVLFSCIQNSPVWEERGEWEGLRSLGEVDMIDGAGGVISLVATLRPFSL